jgi:hypothetical protein
MRRRRTTTRAWLLVELEEEGSVELFGQGVELVGIEESAPCIPSMILHRPATATQAGGDASRMQTFGRTTAAMILLHLRFDLFLFFHKNKTHIPISSSSRNQRSRARSEVKCSQSWLLFLSLPSTAADWGTRTTTQ